MKYSENIWIKRTLPILCIAGCALFERAAVAAEPETPAVVDTYKSWTMLYGREATPSDEVTMTMGVMMQPSFTLNDSNNPATDKSEFYFQRLRWYMKGSITKDVDYLLVTEWARNGVTAGGPVNGNGSARIFRASATFREVLDLTNIQVGSVIVPFGQALYVPAESAPWVNYTRMQSQLYACGSIGCIADGGEVVTNIFKTGVMSFDQISFSSDSSLTYTAGIYNSTGVKQADEGDEKDFNGSLEYHNGSIYAQYGLRLGSAQILAGPELNRERHALVLRYNNYLKDKWWVWGELMTGKDETALAGPDLKAKGYELSAGYKLTPKWEAVVRYSEYDPNTAVSNDTFQETSLGLSQRLDRGMLLQYQADIIRNDNNSIEDNVFTVRLTVPFAKKLL
jgi:hypothetical protein